MAQRRSVGIRDVGSVVVSAVGQVSSAVRPGRGWVCDGVQHNRLRGMHCAYVHPKLTFLFQNNSVLIFTRHTQTASGATSATGNMASS